jgi:hypothetical protein
MNAPHRCAACLEFLPRERTRFIVFVPEAEPNVMCFVEERIVFGREDIVCEDCVGWYHDGAIEVTADEVEL